MPDESSLEGKDTPLETASRIPEKEEVNKMVETPEQEAPVRPKRVRKPRRVTPGSNGAVRVIKVVKPDSEDPEGVYQHRYPRADKLWDRARLNQELSQFGFVRAEEAGLGLPHYCELSDCWEAAADGGSFCSKEHRTLALTAHDRMLVL